MRIFYRKTTSRSRRTRSKIEENYRRKLSGLLSLPTGAKMKAVILVDDETIPYGKMSEDKKEKVEETDGWGSTLKRFTGTRIEALKRRWDSSGRRFIKKEYIAILPPPACRK